MERLQSVRSPSRREKPEEGAEPPARERRRRRWDRRTLPAMLLAAAVALAACRGSAPSPPPKSGRRSAAAPQPQGAQSGERTVDQVIAELGDRACRGFRKECGRRHIAWPPARLTLLAFKREKSLEVWGANPDGAFARIGRYPILAASGGPGPKRRQGDRQVPEGFYRLPELNPNSAYHLSIRVDYPNAEDIRNATVPLPAMGGDIYIHGRDVSIGCIAIGDRGIEELFALAALVPEPARRIIIAPRDFRRSPGGTLTRSDPWVAELYRRIAEELREFPPPR